MVCKRLFTSGRLDVDNYRLPVYQWLQGQTPDSDIFLGISVWSWFHLYANNM